MRSSKCATTTDCAMGRTFVQTYEIKVRMCFPLFLLIYSLLLISEFVFCAVLCSVLCNDRLVVKMKAMARWMECGGVCKNMLKSLPQYHAVDRKDKSNSSAAG